VSAIAELSSFLGKLSARCGGRRWFGPKIHVDIARDILDDVASEQAKAAQNAHKARVSDDEAAALIERVIADGTVTACEVPTLRKAVAHVRKSAELDHDLSEALQP
jgi:hypothetical protein